jgi:hypothetical protein
VPARIVVLLVLAATCLAQPTGSYLPHGVKTYLVNYGAVAGDPFKVDFAARQFTMIDEQSSNDGRRMRAINPNLPVLSYRCAVSSYQSFPYYYDTLSSDERCFMHSFDPACLHVSRQGSRMRITWANDRRYAQIAGYRLRVAADSFSLGTPLFDSLFRTRLVVVDTALCRGLYLHVSTVLDSTHEAWYSFSRRIIPAALPDRHHYPDSICTARYSSTRDTLRLWFRSDSTVVPDSVVAQVDLNHNRNPAEPSERFRLSSAPPFCTLNLTWDRSSWNAGTGFRVLVWRAGVADTFPTAGFLLTTNWNNRTRSSPYGNELMNPANLTWQNYCLARLGERLATPDYAGVFPDNSTQRAQSWMYEVPRLYAYDTTVWRLGTVGLLSRMDTMATPYPVLFNGLGAIGSETMLPWTDGGMFEGWLYSNWGGYSSEANWRVAQNQVLRTCNTYNRIFLALPQAQVADTGCRLYVYGSFLLTSQDRSWYANANSYSIFAHFPEMNLCLGQALDTARLDITELRHANGYYVRRFERGVVLVNPDTFSRTLSGSYPANLVTVSPGTTIGGSRIYSVPFSSNQIGPRTALILLSSPLNPPVIAGIGFDPPRPSDRSPNLVMARVTGLAPLLVEASLERILGPAHVAMNDSGLNGDTLAGDSVFTGTFSLPIGVPAREETCRILAYDTTGLVTVAKVMVRPAPGDSLNWLPNWSFEYDANQDNVPDFWYRYSNGFTYDTSGANAYSGRRSVHVSTNRTDSMYGTYIRVDLNQPAPEHVVVSAWSKANSVSGVPDNHYAVYVDVTYTDSTRLYGQCAQFRTGTHDWEFSSRRIQPTRPIWYVYLYCLFRYHSGEIWFDHVACKTAPPPLVPGLLAPALDTAVADPGPDFDWTDVEWGVRYRLQVDDDSLFLSPAVDTVVAASSFINHGSAADGTYYWRVQAADDASRWSGWSLPWHFAIDTRAPDAPFLLAPDSAANRVPLSPTFAWTEVEPEAPGLSYRLQLATDSGFAGMVLDTVTHLCTLVYPRVLDYSSDHYWWVRATDRAGNTGAFSSRFQFRTVPAPAAPGWHARPDLPPGERNVKDGAWLAYTGSILAARGNKSTDFYSYNPEDSTWFQLRPIPPGREVRPPYRGAAACSDGAGAVYATKGNNTQGFWRYLPETDSWQQLSDVPLGPTGKKVKGGTDLAYMPFGTGEESRTDYDLDPLNPRPMKYSSGYVYLLKGYKDEFWRYSVSGDSWHLLASPPRGQSQRWNPGSWLVAVADSSPGFSAAVGPSSPVLYAHKAKYHDFYSYSVRGDTWQRLRSGMPLTSRFGGRRRKVKVGGCAVWDQVSRSIYALKGGNTNEFWSYLPAADTWLELDTIPARVKAGADIVSSPVGLHALSGNRTGRFWRYTVEPAQSRRRTGIVSHEHAGVQARPAVLRRSSLAVSPNPLRAGFATLQVSGQAAQWPSGPVTVSIYDASGRCVLRQASGVGHQASSVVLDLRSLRAGVYMLKLTAGGCTTTQKLVIRR